MLSILNGGKLRHFLSPFNLIFVVLKFAKGGYYTHLREGTLAWVANLRLLHHMMLGLKGVLLAVAWLIFPVTLLAISRIGPPVLALVGILGGVCLAAVLIYLPYLQLNMARTGRFVDGFNILEVRRAYRRAPWLWSLAFVVLVLFAVPLYLLKIQIIPREAAWLPGLVFILFIYPARLLLGWAMGLAYQRPTVRHWFFRWTGRLPYVPVALFYTLVVYMSQYTSWYGVWSLYEQHIVMLPVPFISL
jgi:hypothetical protein